MFNGYRDTPAEYTVHHAQPASRTGIKLVTCILARLKHPELLLCGTFLLLLLQENAVAGSTPPRQLFRDGKRQWRDLRSTRRPVSSLADGFGKFQGRMELTWLQHWVSALQLDKLASQQWLDRAVYLHYQKSLQPQGLQVHMLFFLRLTYNTQGDSFTVTMSRQSHYRDNIKCSASDAAVFVVSV
jgi:hypothetical protein